MNTYQKWMDFSTRLINIMDVTDERREKIMIEVRSFISRFKDEEIHGWDTTAEYKFYGKYCIGSIADDTTYFGEYMVISEDGIGGKFYDHISAATKAGLDVATEEFGGGVIGFTIGDVRKAYNGHIPDWVCKAMDIEGDEEDGDYIWL
jgi:hypothetical protein